MTDTINQVGAGAPADRLREALAGLLAIVDESRGVSGYHLNGAIAEWDEFPEVEAARAVLAELPECGCCGKTGECDADRDARQAAPAAAVVQTEQLAGIAVRMPNADGVTVACFCEDHVPAGTRLYTAPPAHPDAALAAVTAERDQSRAEAAQLKNTLLDVTTRHFASSWKRRTDDAELERYLSDGIAQLEAERDQLRAEVEARRSLLQEIGEGCNRRDMPSEAQIAAWATRIDAAMAAKEGK